MTASDQATTTGATEAWGRKPRSRGVRRGRCTLQTDAIIILVRLSRIGVAGRRNFVEDVARAD